MTDTAIATENRHVERNEKWQKKLLPLMSRMIIVLSAFFFLASLLQVIYLQQKITTTPQFDASEAISGLTQRPITNDKQLLEITRLKTQIMLEGNMVDNLYQQARVLLMTRLWTTYIGFVTGMILALVGATFVLGKLETSPSALNTKTNLWDFSINSASPGLVLAVLGTTLMLATIFTHHPIETNHRAIYLHDYYEASTSDTAHTPVVPYMRPPKQDTTPSPQN